MFCSTIIPTIGRETLSKSVESVLNQTITTVDFEVIVVNDSGQPLPAADWQQSDRVRIIHTNRRKLSIARNTGAAIARGQYLHFLDDDDWLLPDALENFWGLSCRAPNAAWLYGGVRFVDETGKNLGELNLGMDGNCYIQLVAGSWIPAQVSLIKSKVFFEVGGFNPLFGPTEEIDLGRRIALHGELVHLPNVVASMLRGAGWETAMDYEVAVNISRISRETLLDEPGTFSRARGSATTNYWRGRILKAYLASIRWNWQQRRIATVVSRAVYGSLGFLLAGPSVFYPDYWQAVIDTQVPCTQARALIL